MSGLAIQRPEFLNVGGNRESEDGGDGGEPPSYTDRFRESLSPDERKEFDSHFVTKADMTRMRQKDTDAIRGLEERFQTLEQRFSGGQQQAAAQQQSEPEPAYLRALEERGVTPDKAKELYDLMKDGLEGAVTEAVNRVHRQYAPFVEGFTNDVVARNLREAKESLFSQLGEKAVAEHWDAIEKAVRGELRQGRLVDAETAFRVLFPDDYRHAIALAEQRRAANKRKQSTETGSEGFTTFRHTNPMSDSQPGPEAQRDKGPKYGSMEFVSKTVDGILRDLKWR